MSKALGLIETRGLVASIEAADAMAKAAQVGALRKQRVGGKLVMISLRGDVGAVRAAVEAGAAAARKVGQVVAVHIIPRPHEEVEKLLSGSGKGGPGRDGGSGGRGKSGGFGGCGKSGGSGGRGRKGGRVEKK